MPEGVRMIPTEIQVVTAQNKLIRLQWKRQWYAVTSIKDNWVDTDEWWNGEGEKTFYRISTGNRFFEIYCDEKEKAWHIYRVYD